MIILDSVTKKFGAFTAVDFSVRKNQDGQRAILALTLQGLVNRYLVWKTLMFLELRLKQYDRKNLGG